MISSTGENLEKEPQIMELRNQVGSVNILLDVVTASSNYDTVSIWFVDSVQNNPDYRAGNCSRKIA